MKSSALRLLAMAAAIVWAAPHEALAANEARCAGFASFSHYLMAAWSTDAGQRIGAASEIEGGLAAPDLTVPARPNGFILK